MNRSAPLVSFLMAVSLSAAAEVPKNIHLVDGRTLEGVKEAQLIEGKVKITHDSGVSRHPVSDLALASQKELGLLPKDKAGFIVPEVVEMPHGPPIPKLWTIKGKHFENVRAVKILNPSEISFTHDGGVVTLRIDQLEREFRQNYGYDKEKSKAYDAQCATIAAEKVAIEAENSRIAEELAKKEDAEAVKIAKANELAKLDAQVAELNFIREAGLIGDEAAWRSGNIPNYWKGNDRSRQLQDAAAAKFYSGRK